MAYGLISGQSMVLPTLTNPAQPNQLLTGTQLINQDREIVNGTMPNRGTITRTLTQQGQQYTIPQGYHSGSGKITANFSNLTAGNVREGVNIGGVVGTYNGEFPLNLLETFNVDAMSYTTAKLEDEKVLLIFQFPENAKIVSFPAINISLNYGSLSYTGVIPKSSIGVPIATGNAQTINGYINFINFVSSGFDDAPAGFKNYSMQLSLLPGGMTSGSQANLNMRLIKDTYASATFNSEPFNFYVYG